MLESLDRSTALQVGEMLANRWYKQHYVRIKTQQNIERIKKATTSHQED